MSSNGVGLSGAWGYRSILRTSRVGGSIVLLDVRDPIAPMHRHGVTRLVTPAPRSIVGHLPPDAKPPPALETIDARKARRRRSIPGWRCRQRRKPARSRRSRLGIWL